MRFNIFTKYKFVKIATILLLFVFILLPVVGFYSMQNMDHKHNIHFVLDCPYLEGGFSVCPLNLFGHLNLIKSISFGLLSFAYIFNLFFIVFVFKLIFKPKIFNLFLYIKRYSFKNILILYRELFTRGILNPKVF